MKSVYPIRRGQMKSEKTEGALVIPETNDLDSRSSEILTTARAITIQTSDENEHAAIFLRSIKTLQGEIEARFKPAKDAAYAAHKHVCSLEKEHINPLKEAESIVKKVMASFMIAEERRRFKEQEKLNAKAEKKGEIAPVIEVTAKPNGISMSETWSAEVEDIIALAKAVASGKVPSSYILPNESLLNQQARSLKGELRIPGVKVVCKKSVAAQKL